MISPHKQSLRALISTIEPIDGGVPTMTRWVCTLLEECNITPVIAWYAPWRNYPRLSVPSYKVVHGKSPGVITKLAFGKYEGYGIGTWLPELEFTHYLPTHTWKELVGDCQLHLAVSGNALSALPYLHLKKPFLAWIATPWEADRKDRIRNFTILRRLLDAFINTPFLRRIEKQILSSPYANILSLSTYTSKELTHLAQKQMSGVMYMPIDPSLFFVDRDKTVPWRIGFSGRYCDPRKNIGLLLNATKVLLQEGHPVELILVGDRNADQITPIIRELDLERYVRMYTHMRPLELAHLLQTLDLFTIPSHQEGLCIAALEAMACGVPIVSTRCGGPEDYVQSGVTGELVDKTGEDFAMAIKNICLNREQRHKLSEGAILWVADNASPEISRKEFRRLINDLADQHRLNLY
jgi:glycosyltransferase involved in cell wall biosynthesis